jgi:hypothetical protein
MYKCLFPPCPYKSKRESNCKQHMEKAHNWQYVRTKTNGGKKTASKAGSVNHAPTPYMEGLPTPISNPSIGMATPPQHPSIEIDFPDFNFNDPLYPQNNYPQDLDMPMQFSPDYSVSPVDNSTPNTDSGLDQSSVLIQDNASIEWNDDIYSANLVEVPMPILPKDFADFAVFAHTELPKTYGAPHISPIGHGNTMLYTPLSLAEVDDCFGEDMPMDQHGGPDFLLFPPNNEGKSLYQQQPLFTNEMPSMAAGYSQPNSQEMWGTNFSSAGFNHYSQQH